MTRSAGPVGQPARPAIPAYLPLFALAAGVIAADQASKAVVADTLRTRNIDMLNGAIRLTYTRNTGAAFSILPSGGLVFAVVAVAVSLGIVVYYRRVASGPALMRAGLALVLGGAIGNLIDRIRLGYVVDFIDLRWWPVFNVADSAIVIGVALLVLQSLVAGSREAS
jgi:signal peptidase II